MGFTSFLTLEDYKGNVSKPIAIESFSFDVEQTLNIGSQSGGAGAGKITFNPFSVTRFPDLMSAVLLTECASGTPSKIVTLTVTPNGASQPVATYRLGLAAVKTISIAGSQHGGLLPTETVAFEYASLQSMFYDSVTNQTTTGTWNIYNNNNNFYTGQ